MTKDEAVKVAEGLLSKAKLAGQPQLRVDHDRIWNADTHWVIGWNSAEFLDHNNTDAAIIGNSPYAIDKTTGRVDHQFDTTQMAALFLPDA